MENVRKAREIKLESTEKRRSHLVSEPNYHKATRFSEKLLFTEINKIEVKMSKLEYLGLLILAIHKIAMYEYWYDYAKPKHGDKAKLC